MGKTHPQIFFIFILTAVGIHAACPNGLSSSCTCEEHPIGFNIKCRGVTSSLSDILNAISKLRVQRLTIVGTSLPELQRLPTASIRSLHLVACNISKIEANAFTSVADDLEELVLANNSLSTIPLLGQLPKLLSLNLNYNQLRDVSEGVFEGTPNLRHLRIEGNKICALSRNALNETKTTLELLDMSGNCLTKIPAQNLRNSIRLMYLDLSENNIAEISNFELMNLPILKELRVGGNKLVSISSMAFMNVPQLQYLYMQQNLLSAIDSSKLFQVFKQLEVLDLSKNQLTKIPSFKELPNIRQVRLDSNRISRVETLAFSSNPRLQLINLQDNGISTISRNSFDSLDQLVILLLANNSIKTIERGMLDGMKNLQQLNLRNNSLSEINNATFNSVTMLTTLDLSHNGLTRIDKNAFTPLKKLFWLDLSSNMISSFEKGTFTNRIANILLDGNPFNCDEKLDWFVDYLVRNQVRTFLPYQQEVVCASPEKYAGVRLKELMIKKANDTLAALGATASRIPGQEILSNLIPRGMPRGIGMERYFPNLQGPASPNPFSNVPVIGAITEAIPAMRNIPGLNFIPKAEGDQVEEVRNLNNAIEQFSSPLIRVATGGVPVPADIEQIIRSIPNLIVSVPGFGNIDISKLPPSMIAHVLRGGTIPGTTKEVTDRIVKQFMTRMHAAAEAANRGQPLPDEERYLPPLEKLPRELVTDFVTGASLPHLDEDQMTAIREYYTAKLPTMMGNGNRSSLLANLSLPPQLVEMMNLLPPGYDIKKIPKEVFEAVARGEIPEFRLLPSDLQHYLLANSQKLFSSFANKPNVTIDDILKSLPTFERPDLPTFSPYDINEVNSDLTLAEKEAEKQHRVQYYTAVLLGLVGAVSVAVLSLLCIYMRRKHILATDGVDEDSQVMTFQMPPPQASSSPKTSTALPSYLLEVTPSRRTVSRTPQREQ